MNRFQTIRVAFIEKSKILAKKFTTMFLPPIVILKTDHQKTLSAPENEWVPTVPYTGEPINRATREGCGLDHLPFYGHQK